MSIEAILERLEMAGINPLDLLRVYRSDEKSRSYWQESPRLYRAFARTLIQSAHPTRAFELVRDGLEAHPKDEELAYLGALALRRGGNIQRAGDYVHKLLARPNLCPSLQLEALSLAGSIAKELYIRTAPTEPDPRAARRSADFYSQAYEIARDEALIQDRKEELFPGINAATMSFLADDLLRARTIARAVLSRALAEQRRSPENTRDYWLQATMGEAMLLIGDLPGAALWYSRAVDQAKAEGKDGEVSAMRRNFQLLRAKIPLNEQVWGFFNVGNVIAFAGHLIDSPERPGEAELPLRFPNDPRLVVRVEEEIERHLNNLNARVGYCSVACGSDILFAERMLERKAELHVVLPFELEDFYRTSVDYGFPRDDEMGAWRLRCDRVLRKASQIHHATTERHLGDDVLFTFSNMFIQGLAILRAAERGVDPIALAVLDQRQAQVGLEGGTADFFTRWTTRGLEGRVIDLCQLREEVGVKPVNSLSMKPPSSADARVRRKTRVMLFADVKNFSKLDDVRYPDFFATFLDEVKQVIEGRDTQPIFVNTWGDGLYVVFERVVDGADFALRLVDRVAGVDWAALGLPADTTVRIGMHAGPVYQRMDPIIGRENVFGSQVIRAARIEPVTTPGSVFVSEQFAATLAVEAGHPFHCEYVGIEELAKGYGRCALYLLGRRS